MTALTGAYLFMLATLIAGVWYRPAVAVTAVLCMFSLDQIGQISVPWLRGHAAFTNYAIGGIVVLALARAASRAPVAWSSAGGGGMLAVAFFAYALMSAAWSPAQESVWRLWSQAGPYLFTCIVLAPLVVRTPKDIHSVVFSLAALGGFLAIILLVFANWNMRGLVVDATDPGHTNPLELATLGGFASIAAIVVSARKTGLVSAVLRYGILVAGALLIIKSGSRGQLLALALAALTAVIIRYRVGNPRQIVAAVLAIAILASAIEYGFSQFAVDDARWTSTGAMESTAGRLDASLRLLGAWVKSPVSMVFGIGNSGAFDPRIVGFYPHVMPLEVLGEEGLIGFGMLIAVLCVAIGAYLTLIRADDSSSGFLTREAGAFLAAAGIFTVVSSLKQGSLLSTHFLFMSLMILFRVSAIARETQQAAREAAPEGGVLDSRVARRFSNILR